MKSTERKKNHWSGIFSKKLSLKREVESEKWNEKSVNFVLSSVLLLLTQALLLLAQALLSFTQALL